MKTLIEKLKALRLYFVIGWRSFLFRWTRKIVLKYFRDEITMVEGSAEMKGKPIAWTWTFIDEKWEKVRYHKR